MANATGWNALGAMKMACTKELSVGNRIIDSAHKEVFGMIDRVAHSIMARDIAALSEAFDLLENCLCAYFTVEENIARVANFDFSQHRLAHRALLNEFQHIKGELMAMNDGWLKFEKKVCIDPLKNCLIRHIKVDSKSLKIVLNTHFYDFKPECACDNPSGMGAGDAAAGAVFPGRFFSADPACCRQ